MEPFEHDKNIDLLLRFASKHNNSELYSRWEQEKTEVEGHIRVYKTDKGIISTTRSNLLIEPLYNLPPAVGEKKKKIHTFLGLAADPQPTKDLFVPGNKVVIRPEDMHKVSHLDEFTQRIYDKHMQERTIEDIILIEPEEFITLIHEDPYNGALPEKTKNQNQEFYKQSLDLLRSGRSKHAADRYFRNREIGNTEKVRQEIHRYYDLAHTN